VTVNATTTATFFDPHQRATCEAAMARIIPTDDLPGAREAGTVDFVDRYLSGIDYIYAKPDGSGFEALSGRSAAAWQRRVELAREKYVDGIRELDRRAQALGGKDFLGLSESQQDQVLTELEQGFEGDAELSKPEIPYGIEPALQQTNAESELDFFPLLVTHTRQGFLADPIYGGNRDHIGWQVIGFPGPASLAEVHSGSYSTLNYFADDRRHRGQED
jgi:gluconate 2-dehydrogenase gamma chain